jgi:hypothetical protein
MSAGTATPSVIAAAIMHTPWAWAANAKAFMAALPSKVPMIAGLANRATCALCR